MTTPEKLFEVVMTAQQVSEACSDWARRNGLAPSGKFYVKMTTTVSREVMSVVLTGYPPRDGEET